MSLPVVLSWSGGKDSVLALKALQENPDYDVFGLLTTLTRGYNRISMHGVRFELLQDQARSLGLNLFEAWISKDAGHFEYQKAMKQTLNRIKKLGITTIAFGDLFLEDIRVYREKLITSLDMNSLYPLWGQDTTELFHEFIEVGFRAKTCCIDTNVLSEDFCGRELTPEYLSDLPDSVDPCGENGEFHSFVFDGPMFFHPLDIQTGCIHREGNFSFCDLTNLENQ